MNTEKWFTERNKRVIAYQQKAIVDIKQSMFDREITVLAASPSAGKTLMSIKVIEDYLKVNPNAKVLVLTHGTTILRTQFFNVLKESKPDFTYASASSCEEYQRYSQTKQVVVTLPQTISRCAKISNIDLLVVDEAHEFYFAKTVKNIINQGKVKKQLLLTGTPSEFILNKFHIIPIALNTVYDVGMISDFYVEIASSNYNFEFKDFNGDGDLVNPNRSFHKANTEKTLDELIKSIVVYLKSIRGNDYTNLIPEWLPTLKSLKKTMIACKSQYQAKQVLKYFQKIGVNAVLSISDTDVDSEEIKKFVNNQDILVLIVVGRGILGFNYPELVNIVDMTMSYNIDRIYQLLCRIARLHPNGDRKLFFKIAPQMLTDYYQHIMTAVCMLTEEEFFLKYNGKNFREMEIIIKKDYGKSKTSRDTSGGKSKQKKYKPIDMNGLPVFEFFKSIYHKKGELLEVYAKTRMIDIRSEFMDKMPPNYWTLERCKEDALKYKSRNEWQKNSSSGYSTAAKNKWLDKCVTHMRYINRQLIIRNKKIILTKEMCIESARQFNTVTEWQKNGGGSYNKARQMGWFDECIIHMNKPIILTKEMCIESARQFNTQSKWRIDNYRAFNAAKINNWFDECIIHMNKPIILTKEMCIEEAKKYTSRKEWQKNNSSAYSTAHKRGWFEECSKHFIKLRKDLNYWTKEKCIEKAKESTNRKDFYNSSAYMAAKKHGWLEECKQYLKSPFSI